MPDASGPWLVKLGCRNEGGDHCNHGVLNFSLGSAIVVSAFRSTAYVLEATPMRALRDVCIRGVLLPRISDLDARRLLVGQALTHPAKILEVVAQVGVSLN